MEPDTDILIIGAGPAGLAAGVRAGARGLNVSVVERQPLAGGKFCYSSMGRAGVSNNGIDISRFHGRDFRFVTDALNVLPLDELVAWLSGLGVELENAEHYGLVQPVHGGGDVIASLAARLESSGGCLITGETVTGVEARDGAFVVRCAREVSARAVVLATGGANLPQLGGGEEGYRIAEKLGHTINPPAPALVGLMVADEWARSLPGLWMDVHLRLTAGKRTLAESTGSVLFTAAGITGEAVFNVSYAVEPALAAGDEPVLHVNFHPGMTPGDVAEWLRRVFGERSRERASQAMDYIVPQSLGDVLLKRQRVKANARVRQLEERQRDGLLHEMLDMPLHVTGTLGMNAAEGVTGGVHTREVDPCTFASKRASGLFVVGQALDVHADWGGFEQHFALASGYLAGESVLA